MNTIKIGSTSALIVEELRITWERIIKHQKKNDIKGWKKAEEHIKSGKVFYRGS